MDLSEKVKFGYVLIIVSMKYMKIYPLYINKILK